MKDEKDLLAHAGKGYRIIQAKIPVNGLPVFIEYTTDQLTLHNFPEILSKIGSYSLEQWIEFPSGGATEADEPLAVPKIVVSKAFDKSDGSFALWHDQMSFIYVVQGVNGSRKAKVMLATDIDTAAVGMVHAAASGHSVVFSAAICRPVARMLFQKDPRLVLKPSYVRASTWQEVAEKGTALIQNESFEGVVKFTLKTFKGRLDVSLVFSKSGGGESR